MLKRLNTEFSAVIVCSAYIHTILIVVHINSILPNYIRVNFFLYDCDKVYNRHIIIIYKHCGVDPVPRFLINAAAREWKRLGNTQQSGGARAN